MITQRYREHRIYAQCYPARDQVGQFAPMAIIRGQLFHEGDEPIFSERRCQTPDQAETIALEEAKKWIDDHQP